MTQPNTLPTTKNDFSQATEEPESFNSSRLLFLPESAFWDGEGLQKHSLICQRSRLKDSAK